MHHKPARSSVSTARTSLLRALGAPVLTLAVCGANAAATQAADAERLAGANRPAGTAAGLQDAEQEAARQQAEAAARDAAAAATQRAAAAQQRAAAAQQRAAAEQQRAAADDQAAGQSREQRPTTVVPVAGNPGEFADAITRAFEGAVTATFMGNALVLTGEKQDIERAQRLIGELNETFAMNREREHVEAMRLQELELARRAERMPVDNRVFDVTFGPTLGDSLAALATAVGTEKQPGLNIVYTSDESLAKIPVRAVQLQRVTVRSAISTLESIVLGGTRNESSVELSIGRTNAPGESPVVTVSPRAPRGPNVAPPAYHVAVFRTQGLDAGLAPEQRTEVLQQQSSTLQAIEIGLEIFGRSPEFKIKLHPETGLLFVNGTRDEVRIVAEVLDLPNPLATESVRAPMPGAAAGAAPSAAQAPAPAGSSGR